MNILKSVTEVALTILDLVVSISNKLAHRHMCGYELVSAMKNAVWFS